MSIGSDDWLICWTVRVLADIKPLDRLGLSPYLTGKLIERLTEEDKKERIS